MSHFVELLGFHLSKLGHQVGNAIVFKDVGLGGGPYVTGGWNECILIAR